MKKRIFGRTLRWTCAAAVGILFHLVLFWGVALTRESKQVLTRSTRQFTKIQYFDRDTRERSEILSQQMTMFDPRPLLLPTEWNAASASQLRNFIEEEIFSDFEPLYELGDGNYLDDFGNVPAEYGQLSVAQADFDFSIFNQVGRQEKQINYEQELGFSFILKNPRSGEEIKNATIYNSDIEEVNGDWPDWEPVVFLATVEDSFQVGGLAVLKSSGYDEADRFLSEQTRLVFREMVRLEDGVYLVEIIP